MSKATYPKYRASQWLDTSDDASANEVGSVLYGIEIQHAPNSAWRHVGQGGEPLLFKSLDAASSRIASIRARVGEHG